MSADRRGSARLAGDPSRCIPGACRPGRSRRLDRVGAGRDRGSAALVVGLWALVLALLASAGLVLSSVLAARSATQAAADLGALAGASAALESPSSACRRASAVVRANGGRPASCRVDGVDVWVEVHKDAPASVAWLLPGRGGMLRARAHAELVPGDLETR